METGNPEKIKEHKHKKAEAHPWTYAKTEGRWRGKLCLAHACPCECLNGFDGKFSWAGNAIEEAVKATEGGLNVIKAPDTFILGNGSPGPDYSLTCSPPAQYGVHFNTTQYNYLNATLMVLAPE